VYLLISSTYPRSVFKDGDRIFGG